MLELYTDAATRGNPGDSAIGIFYRGEGHSGSVSKKIGVYSNHEAEFIALVEGIREVMPLNPQLLSIRVDSELVFKAVDRMYVKKPDYRVYLNEIEKYLEQVPLYFIKWIPEKENAAAHRLATEELRRV